ncbi:MAG: acyloxyacyl hydrolase [Bacteroidales bacterium]
MRNSLIILFLSCQLFFSKEISSQDLFFDRIEASYSYGYLAPHHDAMQHLFKGLFPSYQLSLSRQTSGSRAWHELYGYPDIGVRLSYTDLAYPEVLGRAYAIIPEVTFPVLRTSIYRINITSGLGLGYLTKKYERLENYRNSAIGSNINLAFNFTIDNEFIIRKKYSVIAGIGLSHFSNGRVSTPNLGINIPSAKLGVSLITPKKPKVTHSEDSSHDNRSSELSVILSGGAAAEYPVGSKINYRASLSSLFNYPINKKHKIGLGYDIFYYYNNPNLLAHLDEEAHISRFINHGLFVGFQMDFSRLAFIIQKGIYIYDKYNYQNSFFYHRAGFRYSVYKNLIINLTMKTHFFRAQFIEIGLGYKFFKNE